MAHVLGADEGGEVFGGEEAKLDGGFAEADAGAKGGFGDLGGVVVADLGRERGDEHERIVKIAVDGFTICFDADDAIFDEAVAGVSEELDRVQIIENDHGLEDVQLKIALPAATTVCAAL